MRAGSKIALVALGLAITAKVAFSATIAVDSVYPEPQSLTAAPGDDIIIAFADPIDPTTITDTTFRVFGRWSGPSTGTLALENGDTQVRFSPDEPLFYGEWVTVSLTHHIRNVFDDTLTSGYYWNFWVRTTEGSLNLNEIAVLPIRQTGEGQIQSYGAYAGDLNDDGYTDLAIPNEQTNDVRVFLNNNGMFDDFSIYAIPGGSVPSPNEGGDFNRDGYIDVAITNVGNDQLSLLFGDGTGALVAETSYVSGNSVRAVAVVDLDTDGDDDIVTANRNSSNLGIFYNNGDGSFTSVVNIDATLTNETSLAVADANNDGIADLFVGGLLSNDVAIMLGDGKGNLTFSSKMTIGGRSWMLAVGDLDGDGNVDVASANSSSNNCGVLFGNGAGGFDSTKTYPGGSFVLAIDIGDIDGDGDLEMVTSSYSSQDFRLFPNNGDGTFGTAIGYDASSAGSCAILHDRDNDGDMDIAAIDEVDDLLFIFDNSCCFGTVGNVNDDPNEDVTLTDLTVLVNHLFVTFDPLLCPEEANVSADPQGAISLTDLTLLVNHLFVTFEPLPKCPW